LTPTGGTPARLSLQFPGWPVVPEHRMIMFVCRESPAQKFLPAASPRHWKVLEVLLKTTCALAMLAAATRAAKVYFILMPGIEKCIELFFFSI